MKTPHPYSIINETQFSNVAGSSSTTGDGQYEVHEKIKNNIKNNIKSNIKSNINNDTTNELKIQQWLTSQGSLTKLLEEKANQPLRVVPFFEGYKLLSLTQKKQLGVQRHLLNRPVVAWFRESLLYGNDEQPWIQAQSIFPLASLTNKGKRLVHLGSTPIGYVLYKRQRRLPSIRSIALTTDGWQRQTLYDWQGHKLLISETFINGFFHVQ